ncbi:MAG TPA: hypothetical protein VGK73_07015 [Polyangiaceae bacterium]
MVLLEPAHFDRTLEMHARLRGELEAAGFDVVVSRVPAGDDAKEVGEALARELHPLAVLYVVERPSAAPSPDAEAADGGGEIWISDRLLRRSYILKFDLQPGETTGSSRIAVEAVEVLKANLAELSVTRTEQPVSAPPPPEPVAPAPSADSHGAGVSGSFHAGAAVLQGFQGLGPVWTPIVRAGVSVPPELLGGAPLTLDVLGVAAFYGAEARVQTAQGSARVRQSFAGLELWSRFAPAAAVEPFLSLSGGAYRTEIEGSAADPALANAEDTWSFATGIGTGLWAQPSRGFAVIMNAELLLAWARTVVQVAGEDAATAGSPMLLVSVSAAGVF